MKKRITLFFFFLTFVSAYNLSAQITMSTRTDFPFSVSESAQHLIFADINSDGKPDAITANQTQGGISILINNTTTGAAAPTFSSNTDFVSGTQCHGVAAGDINGDGLLDLATANTTAATVSVFLNTTTPGASTPTLSVKTDMATLTSPYVTLLKDINGDGKLDIVVSEQAGNSIGVFINTTTPGASTPTFSSRVDFASATGPTHMTIADFNGDGKPDVAAACNNVGMIAVFLNTTTTGASTPTFAAHTDFTSGTTAWSVISGDFNLDGKPDMVGINRGGASMSVFLNTTATGASTATFGTKTDFVLGSTPIGAVTTDLNNDGNPDIVVTARGNAFISGFINTTTPGATTPTFTTRQDFATPSQPYFVASADLNGDGLKDIGVCTATGNSFSVFLNTMTLGSTPTVSFSGKTEFATGNTPSYITGADFNGDGKPDLACTNAQAGTSSISVFLNTITPGASTPTFSAKTDFATGSSAAMICSADFNGDGRPDMACVSIVNNIVSVFLNTTTPGASTPTFSTRADFAANGQPLGLTSADFNGDGKPDLICANIGTVSVFLNTTTPGASTPTFSAKTDFTSGLSPVIISTGDFNKDGKPDFACTSLGSNNVTVNLNTTTPGASTPTFATGVSFSAGTNPTGICCADINGDGKTDFVNSNRDDNNISVFLNTTAPGASTPTFSTGTNFAGVSKTQIVTPADFNGDGKIDLVVSNLTAGELSIFINTTTPGASTPTFAAKTDLSSGTSSVGNFAGDFNLDGKSDIVGANRLDNTLSVFLNTAFFPLPVELASFSSSVNGNNVMLNWNTVSEENNSGFDVERSSFGAGWNKVGFIAGKGTTNTSQNYSFTDNNLSSGRYSYRLKQIDYNGNYKYYDLQNEVVIGVPSKFALMQNYPNPFNPSTIINYQLAINSFVTLKIFDISGREVKQLVNEVQQAGYYAVDFNAVSLSSGTYFYKLTSDKFSDVKKMVVVK
ncbi:MAG: T9SS type A sorting domain-containing protein [Ignavibacteria bacterium]|nr:T9SS type A sorting domain-containing protein [Ignavibacteria bacterium]